MNPGDLHRELTALLSLHSAENGSDTPDFILAAFLLDCLRAFDFCMERREAWYGRDLQRCRPFEVVVDE